MSEPIVFVSMTFCSKTGGYLCRFHGSTTGFGHTREHVDPCSLFLAYVDQCSITPEHMFTVLDHTRAYVCILLDALDQSTNPNFQRFMAAKILVREA